MSDVNTAVAESSPAPAAVEVPTDRASYDHWRQTGEIKPQAESAPAKKSSDTSVEGEGTQASEKAAASEPEKKQEHKPSKAEARLNELLDDLRKAGYTPAELKSLRKAAAAEPTEKPKPEHTEKPVIDDKAPKRPQEKDYRTWEEYEAAKDTYLEEMADYKAQKRLEVYQAQQRQEAAQKEMQSRLDAAKARYGDGSDVTIVEAAKAIFQGQEVPAVIREVLNESDVLIDVLYTLGKDAEGLAEFLDLAKTKPGAAMRKAILVEKLVSEELGKGGSKAAATDAPERGSDGKFVSNKPPERKTTSAPPPPKETSGRSGPPADEVESAVKSDDFAAYRAAQNRKELLARKGQ